MLPNIALQVFLIFFLLQLFFTFPSKACFAGGMLALGGAHAINGNGERYLEAGKEVTHTCHESYRGTGWYS